MIRFRIEIGSAATLALVEGFLYENPAEPWSLFVMPDGTATIEGYFSGVEEGNQSLAAMEEEAGPLGGVEREAIDDDSWKNAYRYHLKTIDWGPLVWVPIWEKEDVVVGPGKATLYLDSGMAFGTGAHETTQLCTKALIAYHQEHAAEAEQLRVLDAGCGSGILALSAARLGYAGVEGFDFDPEAVRISRENAELNGLAGTVRFFEADVRQGLKDRKIDLLLANIETPVLREHATDLLHAVAPGGWLVLSGILEKEGEALVRDYTRAAEQGWPGGFDLRTDVEGEWISVTMQRRSEGGGEAGPLPAESNFAVGG